MIPGNKLNRMYICVASQKSLFTKKIESQTIVFQRLRYSSSHSLANGPASTLPASLDSPTRKPGQAAFSYYYSVGKAYLGFYKTGMKNIYYNYKASQKIEDIIESKYGGKLSQAVKEKAISRSDFQLLTRNWHDIKRVPLFGLMFAVFGEFTPLVVLAIGNIVPLTCRIPAQITKERKKLEERRRKIIEPSASFKSTEGSPVSLEPKILAQINTSLGLSSQFWNFFGGPPHLILKRRVKKRLEYLRLDDELLEVAGGVHKMCTEEVKMALVERGIDVLGRDESLLRDDLKSWLGSRKKVAQEKLILSRPSEWPYRV
ncbi:putative letm1-like protein [Golovinomyces cichoracearum]|uniref:Putative letm1-like protein n=1 Tax=Golovinomyces cichoracearum TaxID=62708 RepID=A0A420J2M9_9PEZI|nr:putative letm1-like protein [Golovinomyces cichoracearum]